MSKYVNRQKRKARSKDEILQLIQKNQKDVVIEEYIFQYGNQRGMVQESNGKYHSEHYDLIKRILLK
ncbi:hypothetical protein DIDNDMLP_00129 [Klebsiella phage KP13-7]|nr:hypothetical protein DIDNDMLP_00129 [Klebsiella phage KP13-7]